MENLDWSFFEDESQEHRLSIEEAPLWEGVDVWLQQEEFFLWNC